MKLKPMAFNPEELEQLAAQTSTQTTSRVIPKSEDPTNFPVFEIPTNDKVIVYVPNHVVVDEDGAEKLRMDVALLHSFKDGNRYEKFRCVQGLTVGGYSGRCPICEAAGKEPWDLANLKIAEECKKLGLNPEDKDNERVVEIRRKHFSERAVKQADRYFTFPIVVFETSEDRKTILMDDNKKPKYQVMWYKISESAYEKKWEKMLEGIEDEPTHPGGRFYVLNYTYTPKTGEPNKRDSARELQVVHKTYKALEDFKVELDKVTEGWTPAKCAETVIENHFYSEDQLEELVTERLESTRSLIAAYNSKSPEANGLTTEEKLGIPMDDDDDLQVVAGTDED